MESSTFIDSIKSDLIPTIDLKWATFFAKVIETKEFISLSETIQNTEVLPSRELIFVIFKTIPLEKIRVVIVGLDPYHTKGVATGVAFDCNGKPQPSLKNIHKELISEGYIVDSSKGNLTKWVNQGVFLINTALTVLEGKPNSHTGIWQPFTKSLFEYISKECKNLVIILWGNKAQTLGKKMFDSTRHKFIESSHPSPLGANSGSHPFIGSKPFSKTNEILKGWGVAEIDWDL